MQTSRPARVLKIASRETPSFTPTVREVHTDVLQAAVCGERAKSPRHFRTCVRSPIANTLEWMDRCLITRRLVTRNLAKSFLCSIPFFSFLFFSSSSADVDVATVRSSFFLSRSQNRERLAVLHVGRRYPVSSFSLWRENNKVCFKILSHARIYFIFE